MSEDYNPYQIAAVKEHDRKLAEALKDKSFEGLKILVFQPVAAGDNIVASLGAELFKIKYPGCTVDFFTTLHESASVLKLNPYINKVIVEKDWELFSTRDTNVPGPLKKEYDLAYGLYWWDSPMVKSFLADMELPTDYTHVRVYIKPGTRSSKFNKWLKETNRKVITLQNKESLRKVWDVDKHYDKLLGELQKYGKVLQIGAGCGMDFAQTASTLSICNLFVGYHGSQEHMAAAVDCQTVVMSREWNPVDSLTAYYQNDYMPENKKHVVVRPKKWCENFERCITYNPNEFIHKLPPYGFPNRFPPHKNKDCDFGYEKSCIYNGITAEDILEEVDKAVRKW